MSGELRLVIEKVVQGFVATVSSQPLEVMVAAFGVPRGFRWMTVSGRLRFIETDSSAGH
jgi:hypothetical protein